MNYKMICIDIDGTLLGKRRRVSKKSKEVLKEAALKGVHIVITTGRLYNNAAYYSELIGAPSAVIGCNGAIVREKFSDEVIFKKTISTETCKKILELGKKHKVVLHIHTIDKIITNRHISRIIAKLVLPTKGVNGFPIYLETGKKRNFERILDENKDNITKVILFTPSPKRMEKFILDLKKIKDIDYFTAGNKSLEINAKGVSKGNAVKELAKYYKIKREEIICIGDNENDISMIEYAGLSIAMGNGIKSLKEKADYITDTNINDGVRKAIEKFVLER